VSLFITTHKLHCFKDTKEPTAYKTEINRS